MSLGHFNDFYRPQQTFRSFPIIWFHLGSFGPTKKLPEWKQAATGANIFSSNEKFHGLFREVKFDSRNQFNLCIRLQVSLQVISALCFIVSYKLFVSLQVISALCFIS